MSATATILAMGVAVYALRLAGLALPEAAIPRSWEPALRHLPVALLSALVVAGVSGGEDESLVRLVAISVAGLVARRTGRMWACIASGLAVIWLLRLL
jgi:branched-subunit amino acid transport protein